MAKTWKPTDKQLAFVKEYVVDRNGAQAAIRAGYAQKNANTTAARLLANVNIRALIDAEIEKSNKRVEIDQDYVKRRLIEIDQMDVLDIMSDDHSLKPLSEWPKIWRQMISGMDISELFAGVGDEREMIGLLKKIKWPDKVKNLELLGKHVSVGAWREVKEVKHSGELDLNHNGELPEVLQGALDAVYKQGGS